jgi:hypothetical protein
MYRDFMVCGGAAIRSRAVKMGTGLFWSWAAVALQFFAAGAATLWPDQRWIGFLIIVVGAIIAAIVGIVYLSSNFPAKYAEAKRVFFLFPMGLALGLVLAWTVLHWHPGDDRKPVNNVSLRLQFSEGSSIPKEISNTNVKAWRSVFTASFAQDYLYGGQSHRAYIPPQWNIFVIFDRPTNYRQMIVECTGPKPPKCAVDDQNPEWAIITLAGDADFTNLEMSVIH